MRRVALLALLASIGSGVAFAQASARADGGRQPLVGERGGHVRVVQEQPDAGADHHRHLPRRARRQRSPGRRLGRHQSQCGLQAHRRVPHRQPARHRGHRLLHSHALHVEQRQLHGPAGVDRPVAAVLRRHDATRKTSRRFPTGRSTAAVRRPRCRTTSAAASSTRHGRCRRRTDGASISSAGSASCSCASRTRSPRAVRTTRPIPPTSGIPPTPSTRAIASTACRSAGARRTTRALGSAA